MTRYLAPLGLLLASSCLTLLLAEGALRVFAPHSRDHVLPGRLFEIDEHLGWTLKANRRVTHHTRHFDVSYATNASGWRDRIRDGSTESAGYHVLLYGDSLVFGWGVAEDSRFSNLLERSMPSLEIWNLAIPAYGLDQQVLSYQRNNASPRADEVIFFVSEVTLDRCHHDTMYGKPKPMFVKDRDGELRAVPPRSEAATRWLYEVLSPLYLPQFVSRRVAMLRQNVAEIREKRQAGRGSAESPKRVGDLEEGLLALAKETADERGHRMSILSAVRAERIQALRGVCERLGIGFMAVDLERLRRDFLFGRDDPHWTTEGQRLVADQIRSQVDWGAPGDQ